MLILETLVTTSLFCRYLIKPSSISPNYTGENSASSNPTRPSFLSRRQEPTGAETSTPLRGNHVMTSSRMTFPLVRIEPVSDNEEADETVTSNDHQNATGVTESSVDFPASSSDVTFTLQNNDVEQRSNQLLGSIV